MGGRPRIYDDLDKLTGGPSVQKWLATLKDGPSKRTAMYSIARYLRDTKAERLNANGETIMRSKLLDSRSYRSLVGISEKEQAGVS